MFKWLFVALVLALAIYLGTFDVLLKPKAPPPAPPVASSTFPVRPFNSRSEAEHVCGENNIMAFEELTPTESKDAFICSDWWPKRVPYP
jgi:hypothetical protein